MFNFMTRKRFWRMFGAHRVQEALYSEAGATAAILITTLDDEKAFIESIAHLSDDQREKRMLRREQVIRMAQRQRVFDAEDAANQRRL